MKVNALFTFSLIAACVLVGLGVQSAAATTVPELAMGPAATNCASVTEIPQSECEALVALYNGANGPGWTNKSGWLVTNKPCSWFGIECVVGHVTKINLNSDQLSGAIPPQLGNLANLQWLVLGYNQLSGVIPPQLGNLASLQLANLMDNQLSGVIPP